MSEITIINEDPSSEPKNFSKGFLALPFDNDQFKEFIVGLLGKPQTITKRISGNFEIHLKDLQSFYDLVIQRVSQQNNGKLIQFNIKIYFTDRSTVQLGSYHELVTYNEVKPIISEAVQLSWDFLIQFHDKTQPEKQSIELLIIATNKLLEEDDSLSFLLPKRGEFKITIQHTARSWGSDMENMLSNQIESHLIKDNKYRKFIKKYSSKISIGFSALFFLSSIIGSFVITQGFINSELKKVQSFSLVKTHTVDQQLNFLTSYIASGVSTQHYFKVSIFLLISLLTSIGFGIWIDNTASNSIQPSFLVLTRKANEYKDETKKKLEKTWTVFFTSIFLGITTGVIANFIFKWLV
ncbi:hypothetical protein [Mucilaginibacter sp. 22184]|uniref:hypothetical protein n=1 Tax=Mucilaginibacter sp. 22184 TaxID=3453887 RepID=UPI003F85273C